MVLRDNVSQQAQIVTREVSRRFSHRKRVVSQQISQREKEKEKKGEGTRQLIVDPPLLIITQKPITCKHKQRY